MTKPKWTRIEIRLGDIIGWEGNPRLSTVAQAERIIASEKKWGQTLPFFVSPFMDGGRVKLIDGHQRLSAWLTKHGEDFIVKAEQCDRALTEDEQREFVITHHISATGSLDWGKLSSWDAPKLIEWGVNEAQKKQWDNDANNANEMLTAEELKDDTETEEPRVPFGDERDSISTSELLKKYDNILCAFSGGKDSIAMAQFLKDTVPNEKITLVCCITPFDWLDLNEYLDYVSPILDLKIVKLKPQNGDKDRDEKLVKYGYPTRTTKWCNARYKAQPMGAYEKTIKNKIVCMGTRAEESARRANMISRGVWGGTKDFVFPIFDMKTDEVLEYVKRSGVKLHYSYKHFNRFSCYGCHECGADDWAILREHYPAMFLRSLQMFTTGMQSFPFRKGSKALEILGDMTKLDKHEPYGFDGIDFWEPEIKQI